MPREGSYPIFLQDLDSADALFSCPSTWAYDENVEMASWQMWDSGSFGVMAGGACMGTTHFAVYDNQILNELRAESGIDFRSYYWREIPKAIQTE